MAIPRTDRDVKRGTSRRTEDSQARRKIACVGAQRDELEEAGESDGLDGDAAALRDLIREVQATKPFSPSELEALLERAALGDNPSQDRVAAANLDLVISLAKARGEQRLSVPDLVQEGSIGLFEAVRTFSGTAAGEFRRFAEGLISERMDAAVQAEALAMRDTELLIAAATDYERTELSLARELHRAPTAEELAEKLEWTVDRTRYIALVVADARRRHDEELLAFIDPQAIDFDGDELGEFDT